MEVHAHTHPASGGTRKKWTHYLWEFLMLFLAVFCGFLAENQREHMAEHQREKKYMRFLAEDLQEDTMELRKAMNLCEYTARYTDSAVSLLTTFKPADKVPFRLVNYVLQAAHRLDLNISDRTAAQLKNSGSLRLIRNSTVTDQILAYWNQVSKCESSLEGYRINRDAGREILYTIWVIPEVYEFSQTTTPDSISMQRVRDSLTMVPVIDNDPKKLGRLTNLIALGGAFAGSKHFTNLKTLFELAKNLIALIKREYHLE